MRVAVVGAGMAGLACAAVLHAAGHAVVVLDKGRRPGGRVATRRADGLRFNHGAQYATARGEGFTALMRRLEAEGAAAPWPAAGEGRWAGVPGMSAWPAAMAAALERDGVAVRCGRQASALRRGEGGAWALRHHPAEALRPGELRDEGGDLEPFDAVLLAVPHPQAAPLLRDAGAEALAAELAPVVVAPCWTLMLGFDAPARAASDVLRGGGDLAWAAREGGRPGAEAEPGDRWVANASPAWSRARLERAPDAVAPELLALFAAATGIEAAPAHVSAHRWRYALVERPLGRPALWDPALRLGACGDWCLAGRVESAWESGRALGGMV